MGLLFPGTASSAVLPAPCKCLQVVHLTVLWPESECTIWYSDEEGVNTANICL